MKKYSRLKMNEHANDHKTGEGRGWDGGMWDETKLKVKVLKQSTFVWNERAHK